jgi:hypothetical protein
MALFQGNYLTGGISNHIFKSNDPDFEALGLHAFTLDSCSEIWNTNQDAITMSYRNTYTAMSTGNTIFDHIPAINNATGTFVFYDKAAEIMVSGSKSYSAWKPIVRYYENKFSNPSVTPTNKIYDETIKTIKTSLNKGVVFKFDRSVLSAAISGDVNFILQFLERKMVDDKDKDLRIAGIAANVPSIAIPQTIAGNEYSVRGAQLGTNGVGKRSSVLEGGAKNPHNTVAAPVDYYLNESTGKLESGSRRMLATLLTDIEPAPIKSVNIGPSDLSKLSPADFLDNNSDTFMPYNPPTGLAMPVNAQANNPNLLSPNFCKKCVRDANGNFVSSGYMPESVVVTNRFNKTFKKGTTLFLTRVGREWIPEEQQQDPPSASLKVGEWSFCKLIADSDNYFKDASWASTTPTGWSSKTFSPSDYERSARWRFYRNIETYLGGIDGGNYLTNYYPGNSASDPSIATTNTKFSRSNNKDYLDNNTKEPSIVNFDPSKRYLISTIFDQLATGMGGWQTQSWISRTNMNKGEFDGSYRLATEVGVFWGPVYVDGYKNITLNNEYSSGTQYIWNAQAVANPVSLLTPTYAATKPNTTDNGSPRYVPTSNDIPAECTSFIIDPLKTFANFTSLGTIQNSGIITNYIIPPYQNSVKANNTKIQFIPLTANFVGYGDLNANEAFLSYERNFYNRTREYFRDSYSATVGNNSNLVPNNLWSSAMMLRIANTSITDRVGSWPHSYNQYGPFPPKCQFSSAFLIGGFLTNLRSSEKLITYDCYIVKDPLDTPLGNPEDMFNDPGLSKGGNCVGVICGRTTISKRGGGDINFSTISNFGLAPFSQVSAGNFFLGIIPLGGDAIPLLTTNEVRKSPGRPQYGSYTDEIHSFGTTSLSVRVFDAWPSQYTIFDPRHFAVLHFNPGAFGSLPTTTMQSIGTSSEAIDNISTSVDFRIPTWSGEYSTIPTITPTGTIVTSSNTYKFFRYDQWKVNPIRRGMLLTNGGFTYYKNKIGVFANHIAIKYDPTYVDVVAGTTSAKYFRGKKYSAGQIIDIRNNFKIQILTVDGNGGILTWKIPNNDDGIEQNGEFIHSDIPFEFTLPQPVDSNGNKITDSEAATFFIGSGMVYAGREIDLAPKEHVPSTRISSSSKAGKEEILDETVTTSFNVTSNDAGKYDLFTHFHNDITHTLLFHQLYGNVKLQYITMNMS